MSQTIQQDQMLKNVYTESQVEGLKAVDESIAAVNRMAKKHLE